jgi:hypothetical protein
MALMAAGIAAGLAAPAASAAFGVSSFSAEARRSHTPGDLETRAGATPVVGVTDFSFNRTLLLLPDGNVRNIRVDLPPGLVSNPQATPKCTDAQFPACPPATQLGTEAIETAGGLPLPVAPVYNMVPKPGQVSLFAFNTLLGRTDIVGGVRPSDDGLYFTISDVPQLANLTRSVLTFFGQPWLENGAGGPAKWFLRLPTSCSGPQTTRLTVGSWAGETATATSTTPSGATGCDAMPFAPKLSATTRAAKSGRPAGLSVELTEAAGEADVKSVSVKLPKQFSARLDTLGLACAEATFKADPAKCGAGSHVGTVRAATPLLADPLRGDVYLEAHAGMLPTLEAVLTGPALRLDLSGTIVAANGLTSTFGNVPDLPISDFVLDLPAGPHSALAATADLCIAPVTIDSSIVGWNGKKAGGRQDVGVAGCGVEITDTRVRGRAATVTLRAPAAGVVTLSGKGLATKKVRLDAAKTVTVDVALARSGLAALRNAKRRLTLRVRAAYAPAAGAPAAASRTSARLTFKAV